MFTRKNQTNRPQAHPTDDSATPSTPTHEIPSTLTRLPVETAPAHVLHVVPVAGTGAVPQCVFRVDGQVFVGAVKSRDQQHLAVLQQSLVDLAACPRQVIERVQVNGRGHRHDDTGHPVSNAFPWQGAAAKEAMVSCNGKGAHEGWCRLRVASQSLRHGIVVQTLPDGEPGSRLVLLARIAGADAIGG